MGKKKFTHYAVRKGRKPGIYRSWFGVGQTNDQIEGFPKAEFKGFYSERDAKDWLKGSSVFLKHYDKLVDKLAAGDNSVMEEAIKIGNQLREPSVDDGKAPWED